MGRKKKNITSTVNGNVETVCVALNSVQGYKFNMPDGRVVEINGNALDLRGQDATKLPIGVYGLTTVAKADWEWIIANYGGMKIFKNGLCFAANSMKDAEQEADNRDNLRHGWEPVDPKKLKNTQPLKGGI